MDSNSSSTSNALKTVVDNRDLYCWQCHKPVDKTAFLCNTCPRSYHKRSKCLKQISGDRCPECLQIDKCVNSKTRLKPLRDMFLILVEGLKKLEFKGLAKGCHLFNESVSTQLYPDYDQKIKNPMDLSKVEDKIKANGYTSTASFLADIKWIHHNCLSYNPWAIEGNRPFRNAAKELLAQAVNVCKEIDVCVYCCLNYYTIESMSEYFIVLCGRPHNIVSAKVGDFPYWPAKVTKYDECTQKVLVHFFGGKHNWEEVSVDQCFLISKSDFQLPQSEELEEAVYEMRRYIQNLNRSGAKFIYHKPGTKFSADQLYLTKNTKTDKRKLKVSKSGAKPLPTVEKTIKMSEHKKPVDRSDRKSGKKRSESDKCSPTKKKKLNQSSQEIMSESSEVTLEDNRRAKSDKRSQDFNVKEIDNRKQVTSDRLEGRAETAGNNPEKRKTSHSYESPSKRYSIEIDGEIEGFCCDFDDCKEFFYVEKHMIEHQRQKHNIPTNNDRQTDSDSDLVILDEDSDDTPVITFTQTNIEILAEIRSARKPIRTSHHRKNRPIDITLSDDDEDVPTVLEKRTALLDPIEALVKEYIKEEKVGKRCRYRCTYDPNCRSLEPFDHRLPAKQHLINEHYKVAEPSID